MKFAFIILDHFESSANRAEIHNGDARIIGVANMEEAVAVAKELQQDGKYFFIVIYQTKKIKWLLV